MVDWVKVFPDWNKEDEICPNCNHVTKQQKGITRQNMRRLTRFSWTETILTVIIIGGLLFTAWAYKHDMNTCAKFIKDFSENYECTEIDPSIVNPDNPYNITLHKPLMEIKA